MSGAWDDEWQDLLTATLIPPAERLPLAFAERPASREPGHLPAAATVDGAGLEPRLSSAGTTAAR